MDKAVILSAYAKIKADDAFKQETIELLRRKATEKKRHNVVPVAAAAAALAVAVPIVAIRASHRGVTAAGSSTAVIASASASSTAASAASSSATVGAAPSGMQNGGVKLPAVEQPKYGSMKSSGNTAIRMAGFVVHNGAVYTQCGTTISAEDAVKILGQKLGAAKCSPDGWSKKSNFQTELASTFKGDIYTVKGYDSGFELIGIGKYTESKTKQEKEFAQVFQHLNGITVNSGTDVFGKMNLHGSVSGVTAFDWPAGKPVCGTGLYAIGKEPLAEKLIDALNEAKPSILSRIPSIGPGGEIWNDAKDRRSVVTATIVLKDGSHVALTFRKDGYVSYASCEAAFKIPDDVFHAVWNRLNPSPTGSGGGN